MLSIDKNTNNISITRGDSGYVTVNLKKADGSAYEITAADQLVLSVKKSNSPMVLVRCEGDVASDTIRIPSADTKMNSGEYLYDIQLIHNFYKNDQDEPMDAEDAIEEGIEPYDYDVFTVISAKFYITLEVGKRTNTTPTKANYD